ncbi:MAG: N-formylglutamate amidohydrolase [Magnetospirillum sp. WYHS-4]
MPRSVPFRDVPPWETIAPSEQTAPVVFASPHSGRRYPPEFLAASRLDAVAIRRSEDAFIDDIYGAAPDFGAPLLKAHFPRAYVDPNREAWELDPAMFADPLPDFVNTTSPRVVAGLGTIPRVIANGEAIYRERLRFADARKLIHACYEPYHQALRDLIARTKAKFGCCLLVDCHSMPSVGGPMDADPGLRRVDMVLGDRFGKSCKPRVIETAESALAGMGYRVRRNDPYAGGFTTRHYGRPAQGVHTLQIEINRALYMDEKNVEPAEGLTALTRDIARLIAILTALPVESLRP